MTIGTVLEFWICLIISLTIDYTYSPMASEPPTPTRAPDKQFRQMQYYLSYIRETSLLNFWGLGRGFLRSPSVANVRRWGLLLHSLWPWGLIIRLSIIHITCMCISLSLSIYIYIYTYIYVYIYIYVYVYMYI